jgi:hypothetical protein
MQLLNLHEKRVLDDMVCVNLRMFEEGERVWEGVKRRIADGRSV